MNKYEYLNNENVKGFINWVIPRISGEIEFFHQYVNQRNKSSWDCRSIYNAFENYNWKFSCNIPHIGKVSGSTFEESENALRTIEKGMRLSIQKENAPELLDYSTAVLEWGGVKRSNYDKLKNMGNNILPFFQNAIEKLNPETVNSNQDFSEIIMNSGFTKLYSLIIDDFIIYDSRVGAALGLLIKQYLIENHIDKIPEVLNFAFGNARSTKSDSGKINRRNPGNKQYKFSTLTNDDKKHTLNNIYANWLIKELSDKSKFKYENNSVRKLESALFMIGYSVREEEQIENFA